MPNSNFLVFSECFYIERFSNEGYRYYLGQKAKQPRSTITSESKEARKDRLNNLMKKNKWSRAELARHLGVSRAWVSKILNE
jgi:transcriptional regulator with GAF, ATPase, and Fis domain